MKKSVWTSAALLTALTAAGCDNAAKPTPAPTASTPATPTTPTPAATPPAVAPPPAAAIEGIGPFDSLDAYCKDTKTKFLADACKSTTDHNADMCSCNTGNDVIKGKQKIGPLPEATGLASAQLVLVERSAAGKGDCDLAIETANKRGWFVVPALMPCKGAPVAHDSSTWITVSSFDITREDDLDVLTLAWTETTSNQDVDGTETRRDATFTTRCTIGATTLPRCSRPTKS
jgi:hypothetical protein